ncbi:hypothetical protein [Thiomonas sp. FB-6]|uniref:hypothetical protein n=1 Tax=Thiomonas sp. FB-6 TaxID=1158291 RepID=UPI0003A09AEB|nr:hypothetical protein [Thiomonas sp. FB-6]
MMNTPSDSISPELFNFADLAHGLRVTTQTSNSQQLAALSRLLVKKGLVRGLFESGQYGTPWPESLGIPGKKRNDAEALLAGITNLELEQEAARLIRVQQDREAQIEFEKRLGEMRLADFMRLFCDRCGEKLAAKPFQGNFVVSTKELLPVTHFKALARLTKYDAHTREFSATRLSQAERVKLLDLAVKIGKSKKKVTREDILARRKRIREKQNADNAPLHMDFSEAAEDFGRQQALEWLRQGRLDEPEPHISIYE